MFNSFRKKMTMGFISIALVCIIATTYLVVTQFAKILMTQIQNDAVTLALELENGVEKFSLNDADQIQKFIDHSMTDGKNIAYMAVLDKNNKVVAASDKSTLGTSGDEKSSSVLKDGQVKNGQLKNNNGILVHEVSVPYYVGSEIQGAFLMQTSMADIGFSPMVLVRKAGLFLLAIILLASLVAYIASTKLAKPIKLIMADLKKVGEGDLSVVFKVSTKDETAALANTLNDTLGVLRGMISNVKNTAGELDKISQNLSLSSDGVAYSSEEIAASMTQVAQGASHQTDSIGEAVDLLEKFSKNLASANGELQTVSESSNTIKAVADNGTVKIEELSNAVDNAKDAFLYVNEKVKVLNDNVTKINTITEVISSVAEQTNLLALNAAIESARAGEVGRGFAVVADEIRKLAEQVLDSSRDINLIVDSITNNTHEVSETSETASNEIGKQVKIVEETVGTLKDILRETENIVPQIKAVHRTLNGTVESKDDIMLRIQKIAELSQEVSSSTEAITASVEEETASAEELSKAANNLANMSKSLHESVEKFVV